MLAKQYYIDSVGARKGHMKMQRNEEELDKEELEGMGWMCLRHMYV